ncbi:hypothetical protein CROQUDRAFT_652376 [Cronartium quercuum f. sp. fusiforme G11]|uniref:gluconokinase n=1 Tax=Cronartium quercuum f. sp. fusiforme G11 TaxID=708437 RepID=A0A9P6NQP6_9BASI|nr:hypothetical protein CROQUDRAFT_652376 [Cronartium quercuum f. sp. fusiforme G11]
MTQAALLVVMGVSGCGKSTIAIELSKRLKIEFLDGDDVHSDFNIKKMSSGIPLNDEDRVPWLLKLREKAVELVKAAQQRNCEHSPSSTLPMAIIACSALKRSYRDILRGIHLDGRNTAIANDIRTCIIYLKGSKSLIEKRMQKRQNHFMGVEMLESQLRTLEEPNEEIEDSINNSTITILLDSNQDGQSEKSLSDIIENIISQLHKKGFLPTPPKAPPATTAVQVLPPITKVLGPTAEPECTTKTLSLLFEVSESIERCLIPLLHRTNPPSKDYQELLLLCRHLVQTKFDIEDKVNFLGSHPRIGEVKGLSVMSSKEQKNHQPTDPKVLLELERLNQVYETVYPGLRYVTFVNGRGRAEIAREMQVKLHGEDSHFQGTPTIHNRDQDWFEELSRGIDDVFKIAEDRLRLLQT